MRNPPFSIGAKVVLVRGFRETSDPNFTALPKKGLIYCIRGMDPPHAGAPEWGVYLVGIVANASADGFERAFKAERYPEIGRGAYARSGHAVRREGNCPLPTRLGSNPPVCGAWVRETVFRVRAYFMNLRRRLTDEQLASADEEWELICAQKGWPLP